MCTVSMNAKCVNAYERCTRSRSQRIWLCPITMNNASQGLSLLPILRIQQWFMLSTHANGSNKRQRFQRTLTIPTQANHFNNTIVFNHCERHQRTLATSAQVNAFNTRTTACLDGVVRALWQKAGGMWGNGGARRGKGQNIRGRVNRQIGPAMNPLFL